MPDAQLNIFLISIIYEVIQELAYTSILSDNNNLIKAQKIQ